MREKMEIKKKKIRIARRIGARAGRTRPSVEG